MSVSRLAVQADESQLATVRAFVKDLAAREALPSSIVRALLLATDEACSNVVRHAYDGDKGDIEICFEVEADCVEIKVTDRGKAFEWPYGSKLNLKERVRQRKKGGLGLAIIQRLMDEVEYVTDGQANTLRMRKHLQEDKHQTRKSLIRGSST